MCNVAGVMALQGVSGAYSSYSAYQAGQDQNEYYKYVARQNEREAEIVQRSSDRQVEYIQDQAARDSAKVSEDARRIGASQRAVLAASGVQGVTAEDIAIDTLSKADKDRLAVRYNADLRTFETQQETGYRVADLKNQAAMNRIAGKNAKAAGIMNASTGLLNTATSMANTWYMDSKLNPKAPKTPKKTETRRTAPTYSNTPGSKLEIPWWRRK